MLPVISLLAKSSSPQYCRLGAYKKVNNYQAMLHVIIYTKQKVFYNADKSAVVVVLLNNSEWGK